MRGYLLFAALLLVSVSMAQADPNLVVLRDLNGASRAPLTVTNAAASVLLFITHDCPIANGYAPEYRRLRAEYGTNQVSFTLVYVDPDATATQLRQHRSDYGLTGIPGIHDRRHELVAAVKAEMTPEAVVLQSDGSVAYQGRVDNLYADYGKRRRRATSRDLRDALDAVLAGKPVPRPRTEPIGCYIPPLNLP